MAIDMQTVRKIPENKSQVVKFTGIDPTAVWVELAPKDGTLHSQHAEVKSGTTTPDEAIELDEGRWYRLRAYSKLTSTATPDESSALPDDKQVFCDPDKGTLTLQPNVDLLAMVAASLALPETEPRKGCSDAKDLHQAWMDHLNGAYKGESGGSVEDNGGAYETINGIGPAAKNPMKPDDPPKPPTPKTSCSQTIGNALSNFGIDNKYRGGNVSISLPPLPSDDHKGRGKYVRTITKDSLPRAGDIYYLVNASGQAGSPLDHHAIFGLLKSAPKATPVVVSDYSGGQAKTGTPDAPTAKTATDFMNRQRTLTQQKDDIYASGLSTGGVGEGTGLIRRIAVFTDMWQFFQDNAKDVKASTKRGSLK